MTVSVWTAIARCIQAPSAIIDRTGRIRKGIAMKRLFVVFAAVFALCAMLLAGCGSSQAGSSQSSQSAGSVQQGYIDAELALFASAEGAPDKVPVRFYNETPNVPYIGLARYMSLVFGDEAKVEVADGVATVTSTDGGKAVVNDAKDTLASDSWSKFHNYLEPMQQGKRQGYVDYATPFCRVESLDYEQQTELLTFDFSKYGIDLRVDADDAYLPLATVSDLMADVAFDNLAYNGRELCLLDNYEVEPQKLDPAWYEPVAADEPRAQDMVDYSYGELCFVMDNIYSCSGKGILDEEIPAKGLDATLSEKDEVTQRVRELLKSTDKAEYLAGLSFLGKYVQNGHTSFTDRALVDALGKSLSERITAISDELGAAFNGKDYAKKLDEFTPVQQDAAGDTRSQIWPDGASYHEQGDTAVISIDGFMAFDRAGWEAFYAGKGARPDGSSEPDVIGTLLVGLEKAKSNPAIRNVVIDASANGGGSNDLCITAVALLTGKSTAPVRDLATGLRYTIVYDIDSLFNGSFDAAAAASGYDFNYAVLTSCSSFSCGNYFPSLLRDAGVPVIGEISGGGTDMVMRMATPDGQCLLMTDGFAEMTDAQGNQIEKGVPVDVELVTVKPDGTKDYSAFYDIGRLSEIMNGLYSEKALPAAA